MLALLGAEFFDPVGVVRVSGCETVFSDGDDRVPNKIRRRPVITRSGAR
jgi:hypothetical protein